MESLHYGEILGEIRIEYGFIRAIIAGNISLFWGWFVVAWRRVWPCARLGEHRCRGGWVCGRLTASRRFCRVQSLYGSPPRRSFCAYKRNQNTLGAVPQDPLTAKLRLDTNWTFQQMLKSRSVRRRRYAPKVAAGASAPSPYPSPAAGEGPSGQIAACSTHRLGSVTFCDRFAETELNAPAAPYKRRLIPLRERAALPGGVYRRVGFLGRSPKSLLGTFGDSKVPPRR